MFTAFILIIHCIVSVALILIILLQTGKGADIGAVFGGGSSQTIFGAGGATSLLGKITIGAAVLFMSTSIILTYFSGRQTSVTDTSVMTQEAPAAPVQPGPASSEPGPTPPAQQQTPPAAAPQAAPQPQPAAPAPAPSQSEAPPPK